MKPEYKILNFAQKNDALYFVGYSDEDADLVNEILLEHKFSKIPEDYQKFLTYINGMSYDGLMFFGSKPHYRKSKDYVFPSIVSATFEYKDLRFFQNKIVIGRGAEFILIYDGDDEKYKMLNRINLKSKREYNNFINMITDLYNI